MTYSSIRSAPYHTPHSTIAATPAPELSIHTACHTMCEMSSERKGGGSMPTEKMLPYNVTFRAWPTHLLVNQIGAYAHTHVYCTGYMTDSITGHLYYDMYNLLHIPRRRASRKSRWDSQETRKTGSRYSGVNVHRAHSQKIYIRVYSLDQLSWLPADYSVLP